MADLKTSKSPFEINWSLKDLQIEMDELNENIATKEQERKVEVENSKKEMASIKIEMSDLRKNLTTKEDELLATKELLLKEESTPGPKVSCVEDPLNIQSKQSDLGCSVEAIESQNENSSKQEDQENSLGQGNLLRGIESILSELISLLSNRAKKCPKLQKSRFV